MSIFACFVWKQRAVNRFDRLWPQYIVDCKKKTSCMIDHTPKGFNKGNNTDYFWQVTVIIGHSASMSSFYARSTSTTTTINLEIGSLLLSQIWLSLSPWTSEANGRKSSKLTGPLLGLVKTLRNKMKFQINNFHR